MYKYDCRSCGSTDLESVVSLGKSPLANNLLDNINQEDNLYPLELMHCTQCHNCQLSYTAPASEMFEHYLYVSSTAKSFRDHFKETAINYIESFGLNEKSLVIDIGSNDGIALVPLKERGVRVLGVDPAKNVAEIANQRGITTIVDYFNTEVAQQIEKDHGKADIITASNVFAHSDFLVEIINSAFNIMKDDGKFIVEVQYLLDTINDLTFDNIYHEHVNYWSVISLHNFCEKLGYQIYKVEHINTHGGSIRVYIDKGNTAQDESVNAFLNLEKSLGLDSDFAYESFGNRIMIAKENTIRNIKKLKAKGLKLVGYGSPAKATTLLNYFEITNEHLDYIIDDNPLKHNKFVPGVKIPIFSREKLKESIPDVIVVMAWNFFEDIKKSNQHLIDEGIRFVSIKELQNLTL